MAQENKSKTILLRTSIIATISISLLVIAIIASIPIYKLYNSENKPKDIPNPSVPALKPIKRYNEEIKSDMNIPSDVKDLLNYDEDICIGLKRILKGGFEEDGIIQVFSPKNSQDVFLNPNNKKMTFILDNVKAFNKYVSLRDLSSEKFFKENPILNHYLRTIQAESLRSFIWNYYDGCVYAEKNSQCVLTFKDNECQFTYYQVFTNNSPVLDTNKNQETVAFFDTNNEPISSIDFFMIFLGELLCETTPIYDN